jgi:HEAT repeat protein
MERAVGNFQELTEQLHSQDEETRRLAVVGLAAHPFSEIEECLFHALGDGSWRVRKEAVDALLAAAVDEEEMVKLIGLLRSHDNAGLRNSAVEALERLGAHALPVLSRFVGDADHDVRKFVIDIMGNIGAAASCPLLIGALDDPDPNVSAAAAENLGKIGDSSAVPALVQALGRNDTWFRYTILEALSRIGSPAPMAVIAPLSGENLLKKAVFDCLGVIGDVEAVPFLVEGLKERVKTAREAAARALAGLRERLSADQAEHSLDARLRDLAGSPFVVGLLASLETSERGLQEALIKILGIIGDERATAVLLRSCRDERLRRHCLQAFSNMGAARLSSLIGAFATADGEERCFVVYVCGELGFRECMPILDEAMSDPDPMLRRVAVTAAGKIGLTAMLTSIIRLLDDGDPDVREGTVKALARLAASDSAAVRDVALTLAAAADPDKRRNAAILFATFADTDRLSLLIKDEDPMVRKTAVQALGELKSPASVGHLVMALVDEESEVRIAAANALGDTGGHEVLAPLLLALKDNDPWVKCAAMKSLGRAGTEEALSAIAETMEKADGLIMISALESVAAIGGGRAFGMVQKALDDPDEEVVKAAIGILSREGDDWLEAYGEKLLGHSHWDVRNHTVRVMAEMWGEKALLHLRSALERESDDLVKGQIADILDRLK